MSSDIRWWVTPPRPGETLTSMAQRAATLYHVSPETLWQQLGAGSTTPMGPLDAPSTQGLRRLGQAIGLPPKALVPARLADVPWRLAPQARLAVCPHCADEEAAAGAPPIYRADWTRVLTPVCHRHGTCLRLMSACARSRPNEIGASDPDALSESSQTVLALINNFGKVLEGALYFGRPWPSHWRASPALARTWMLRAALPSGDEPEVVPSHNVASNGALAAWVRGPLRGLSPVHGDAWEAFRSITDPAQRRAALWISAWLTIPDLPENVSPGWEDWNALKLTPARWEHRQRQRRTTSHS